MKRWAAYEAKEAHEAIQAEWPYAYIVGHIRAIVSDRCIYPGEKVARIEFFLEKFDEARASAWKSVLEEDRVL